MIHLILHGLHYRQTRGEQERRCHLGSYQQNLPQLAQDRLIESNTYLHSSSLAIRGAYWTVFLMYCSLFVVGLGTAIAAIIRGFFAIDPAETVPTLLFADLSVGSFFTLLVLPVSMVDNSAFSVFVHNRNLSAFFQPPYLWWNPLFFPLNGKESLTAGVA